MPRGKVVIFLLVSSFVFVTASVSFGQDQSAFQPSTGQPAPNQSAAAKLKLENQALALLDEVLTEAQNLKLMENRVHVQMAGADMLWDRNQGRARELLTGAASALAFMNRSDRRAHDENPTALRRELVLMTARHDVELAFQILSATQPAADTADQNGDERTYSETNLTQILLSLVATKDPKAAYQKVVAALDKGEYPSASATVLRQLHSKDKETFEKLSKKLLARLSTDNLLASDAAGNLAIDLLRLGPILNGSTRSDSALEESIYRDLLEAAIRAALTPLPPIVNQSTQGAITFMGVDAIPATRDAVLIVGADGRRGFSVNLSETQPNEAQTRRDNIQSLMAGMQRLLPQVDHYFPDGGSNLRQRLTEVGLASNQIIAVDQTTSENLTTAAGLAPAEMQPHIYQRAAQKAIEEGNLDRARAIANDHLEGPEREQITIGVELKQAAADPEPKLTKIREKLATLPSDSARLRALLSVAEEIEQENPKLALKFLESASLIVCKRAINYEDFENQLSVSSALATLDVKRSFDVFEWGIPQLNEILAASAVVNGFEADIFHEGELPIRGRSGLSKIISRYGWELGSLAKIDFDHARSTADKFQAFESRLLVKLLIAQVLLTQKQTETSIAPGTEVH